MLMTLLQVLSGLGTLAAALRVLHLPHLRYDCKYSRPQLYLDLLKLERRHPGTDDAGGLYDVFCAVRCSLKHSRRRSVRLGRVACRRQIVVTLRRTGFDPPFRNTCELTATTRAYLSVISRFVKCARNLFASVGQ